jgi:hypothetical protein
VVGTSDTQTLTNKTLTSPTIATPTVTGAATFDTATFDAVTVNGPATVTGDLDVGGDADVTGAATVGGTLAVTGAATLAGGAAVTGNITVSGTASLATHAVTKAVTDALNTRLTTAETTLAAATGAAATANTLVKRDGTGSTIIHALVLTQASPGAANHVTRKDYVDAADAALDTRIDDLEAEAPVTSGVIVGSAPPEGTRLIEQVVYVSGATSGVGGDNTFFFPEAFPNGVVGIVAQAVTALPYKWQPWGVQLDRANFRLSSGSGAVASTAVPLSYIVKGW